MQRPASFFPSSFLTYLQIIPRAVDYFTGKALEYDMMDEDEEDYEDIDEEDDDEDQYEDEVCMSYPFFRWRQGSIRVGLTGFGVGWRKPAVYETGSTAGWSRWCRP